MQSVGIALYLAHMGLPVTAREMEFSVRDGLYSSINVADNISLDYSHFYAKVVRVKQATEAVSQGKRLLIMFDELFKGTNVKDAYYGTLAVTEAFSGYRDCLFIISTHIIEVGEALKDHSNIHCVYMPISLREAYSLHYHSYYNPIPPSISLLQTGSSAVEHVSLFNFREKTAQQPAPLPLPLG
ncbi:MAG: hypothetical protein ABUL46_01900 [Chitinophaga rupis]